MKYIDPHVHMVSRTTDDYEALALTGCVAVSEPAFWAGYDRYSAEAFADYYEHITDFEPKRAANYGIQHFAWMCLNPKEGEDRALTKEVLAMIPKYLERPNVIGIGEIGLNRVTRNEMKTLEDHLEMAVKYDQMILIHTPHLEDKFKGTKHIVECIASYSQIKPERVLIDHAEEHTLSMILDKGFWAGITLYPVTKTSSARAIDMVEMYGNQRVCVNSACDWGPSLPTAVPRFAMEMKQRGHSKESIDRIIFQNPKTFFEQSPKCVIQE